MRNIDPSNIELSSAAEHARDRGSLRAGLSSSDEPLRRLLQRFVTSPSDDGGPPQRPLHSISHFYSPRPHKCHSHPKASVSCTRSLLPIGDPEAALIGFSISAPPSCSPRLCLHTSSPLHTPSPLTTIAPIGRRGLLASMAP